MKKTVNINLGGFPFTIDEDAFEKLNVYMDTIENHFSATEGCEDIMSDIEYRICELFQARLKSKQILGMKDLEEVMNIMGRPEDFGAEPLEERNTYSHSSNSNKKEPLIVTGKRLFRDSEDVMIGGVISGLVAYFGLHNVLAVRAIWFLFALSGMGVVVYFVLWAVVPQAVTASDKLAMRGQPINVENIAKTITDEVNDLSDKFSKMGQDYKKSKKSSSL